MLITTTYPITQAVITTVLAQIENQLAAPEHTTPEPYELVLSEAHKIVFKARNIYVGETYGLKVPAMRVIDVTVETRAVTISRDSLGVGALATYSYVSSADVHTQILKRWQDQTQLDLHAPDAESADSAYDSEASPASKLYMRVSGIMSFIQAYWPKTTFAFHTDHVGHARLVAAISKHVGYQLEHISGTEGVLRLTAGVPTDPVPPNQIDVKLSPGSIGFDPFEPSALIHALVSLKRTEETFMTLAGDLVTYPSDTASTDNSDAPQPND